MESSKNTSRTVLEPKSPHVEPASKSNPTTLNLPQGPVTSLHDLSIICERFSQTPDGGRKFLCSLFAFVAKDHTAYYGQSPIRKNFLTTTIVNESLRRVPDEDLYPMAPSHITTATITPGDSTLFIKRPSITSYNGITGSRELATEFLEEAEVMEVLARNPHPNIIRYHGCQVHRDRIVGLALERHPRVLDEFLWKSETLELESGQDDIKSAVAHLHSLGLAHNDISPRNIVIAEDMRWILIDMGSCRSFGQQLVTAGKQDWGISSKRNDEEGLRNLQNELQIWLDNVVRPANSCI